MNTAENPKTRTRELSKPHLRTAIHAHDASITIFCISSRPDEEPTPLVLEPARSAPLRGLSEDRVITKSDAGYRYLLSF